MSKYQAFIMNVTGTRYHISGTGVKKKFMEFLEAVWPLHIHIKVSATFILLFWHHSRT